jgi:replicative DNA helicase
MPQLPVHSREAEAAVLGAMLLDGSRDAFDTVADKLKAEDFFAEAHRAIWRAIVELFEHETELDVLTVIDRLRVTKQLGRAGGVAYVSELGGLVPTAANLELHAQTVRDLHTQRRFEAVLAEAAGESRSGPQEVETWIPDVQTRLARVVDQLEAREIRDLSEWVTAAIEEQIAAFDVEFSGVPSGFTDLDKITGGWQQGDLIILAGRPSMGKTALAMDFCRGAGKPGKDGQPGKRALFVTQEMDGKQLACRILAAESGVSMSKMRLKSCSPQELNRVVAVRTAVSELPIRVDDKTPLRVPEICSRVRREQARHGLDLVVIDYLTLLEPSGNADNYTRAVADMTRGLKLLAVDTGIPIVLLSQLNRECEKRHDKRPLLADLRDSGAIEQDADLVLFLYRDEVYNDDTKEPGVAELQIAKHRNGPCTTIKLYFNGPTTSFSQLEQWRLEGPALH